jgi:FMNH2-dependent dimethyl sulfone monooxygenase
VTPKPRYGRPVLINATGSEAGISFAGRYSDIVFITSPAGSDIDSALEALPAHTKQVKDAALGVGRRVRTLLNPLVISRPTEKEAWELADRIVAHADTRVPRGFQTFASDAHAWKGREGRDDPYAKVGGNIYIIGTPGQVVDKFARLKQAGVDGLQISFFDFKPDLEFFGENILPLMKEAGLRNP